MPNSGALLLPVTGRAVPAVTEGLDEGETMTAPEAVVAADGLTVAPAEAVAEAVAEAETVADALALAVMGGQPARTG
jgi:hypothetical protein